MASEFLSSLVKFKKASEFKQAINTCSESELKSIVECIVNCKVLKLNSEEKKCFSKFNPLVKYFEKRKLLKAKAVRLFLVNRQRLVRILLSCVLAKLIEEAAVCVCDE